MVSMNKKSHSLLSRPSPQIDYLVIGHLTEDITPIGSRLGGTAAFSSLTAQSLGLEPGIITSHAPGLDTAPLTSIWIHNKPSSQTTTFKNISDGSTRTQYLYQIAERLSQADVPNFEKAPNIVHLGPVANEIDQKLLECFPQSLKCLTPQGWMRRRNLQQEVINIPWDGYQQALRMADISVISLEDVKSDEEVISKMANIAAILVVTEHKLGARVYWHNDVRFFHAPEVKYLDDTGAGDIFAAAFFYRYFFTKNPWEAGRFAVQLASWSVTRAHLESIPTQEEVSKAKVELLSH